MASVDPPDGQRKSRDRRWQRSFMPPACQRSASRNRQYRASIVIVRITVEDAANLVLDHLQCLRWSGMKRTPVLAVSHRGLERLCDARMFGKSHRSGFHARQVSRRGSWQRSSPQNSRTSIQRAPINSASIRKPMAIMPSGMVTPLRLW